MMKCRNNTIPWIVLYKFELMGTWKNNRRTIWRPIYITMKLVNRDWLAPLFHIISISSEKTEMEDDRKKMSMNRIVSRRAKRSCWRGTSVFFLSPSKWRLKTVKSISPSHTLCMAAVHVWNVSKEELCSPYIERSIIFRWDPYTSGTIIGKREAKKEIKRRRGAKENRHHQKEKEIYSAHFNPWNVLAMWTAGSFVGGKRRCTLLLFRCSLQVKTISQPSADQEASF